MIDIGIIGCGNIVSVLHLPLLKCVDDVRVKYLADLHAPTTLARDFDTEAIRIGDDVSALPDCDVVLIATPVGVREPYVEAFARKNTLIFTEKPFALNTAQHLRFLEMTPRLSCNFIRTSMSPVQQMREMVSSGAFGHLRTVTVTEGGVVGATGKAKNHFQTDVALCGGGILMERGCHTLSVITHILHGHEFTVRNANIRWHEELDVDVHAFLLASGENDVTVEYHLSLLKFLGASAHFVFDNAEVTFNQADPTSALEVHSGGGARFRIELNERHALSDNQAFYLQWKKVLDAHRGKAELDAATATSLETTRLIDGIYESARASTK